MLKITQDQIATAAKILAQGFFDDPMIAFIFPDTARRLETLVAFFRVFLTDAVKRGQVSITPSKQGVIAWYPSDVTVFDDSFEAVIADLAEVALTFAGLEAAERLEQIGNQVEASEPKMAHCEVLWLGLIPEARGKGLGGELLAPVLQNADENNVGCYLVSSNPRNYSFYERHGFRSHFPITINPTLSLTGMWRDFTN